MGRLVNNQSKKNIQLRVTRIIFSFFSSFLFIWVVGYFFCNSLVYYQYDNTLKKFIHAPFITYKHRSEGVASTHKGKFGINAIKDITKEKRNKIIIWGDSYVEAHHVNDDLKIPQVVSKKLLEQGLANKIMCFGVGMAGDSVADNYFDIPKYEKLCDNIKAHFIIITNIQDTLPDQSTDLKRGMFKSVPNRLVYNKWQPKFQNIKKILNKLHIYFLWKPIRSTLTKLREPVFPVPTTKKNINETSTLEISTYSNKFLVNSWNFLFLKLKEQTKLPIFFIYCPPVPKITNGLITTIDKNSKDIALFTEIASIYNISVVDSTNYFLKLYTNSGKFPRGFPNSKPSEGHFNTYGHDAVAGIIIDQILSRGIL